MTAKVDAVNTSRTAEPPWLLSRLLSAAVAACLYSRFASANWPCVRSPWNSKATDRQLHRCTMHHCTMMGPSVIMISGRCSSDEFGLVKGENSDSHSSHRQKGHL